MIRTTLITLLLISFLLPCIDLKAQNISNGEVSGKIVDEFDETLIGVTVQIKGTTIGNITNINGIFNITNVPLGEQTLVISYLGYITAEIPINVQQGVAVRVNHKMEPNVTELNTVVVVATPDVRYSSMRSSTDLQMVNSIKFSEGVLVGISNEQILKSIDRDASQIAQRIAGVSLVDRFVVVRGMDSRYNLSLVNGIIGPSSEEYSRAFSYDAIPARVIDRMEVDKLPGPHLPAMWGGGVVNVYTKSFSTTRQLNINVSAAARTGGSSFNDNFITYNTQGKGFWFFPNNGDWLANGAKDRRIPALLRQPYFSFPDVENYPTENIALSRSGLQTFTPVASTHNFDKRASVTYNDNINIGNLTLNSLTSLSYTQERLFRAVDQTRIGGEYRISDPDNPPEEDDELVAAIITNSEGQLFEELVPEDIFLDSVYEEQIRIAAVQSLGVEFNDDHNIRTTFFYNRFGTDRVTHRNGEEFDGGIIPYKEYLYSYTQREILMGQLGGYNAFGDHSIDWVIGSSITRNDVPDFQRFRFLEGNSNNPNAYGILYGLSNDALTSFQTHLVFETEEISITGRIDYKVNFKPGFYLKAGVFYDRKERSFFSHRYSITDPNVNTSQNGITNLINSPWLVLDSIYSPENFNVDQWFIDRPNQQAGTYFFDDDSREAYTALNYPVSDNLSVYGGVRYARYERVLYDQFNVPALDFAFREGLFGLERIELPNQIQDYFLPSFTLKFNSENSKWIIRSGYGQTIDRPQFREQAGASSSSPNERLRQFDFDKNLIFQGNPALKNSLIHNADLRFEYYPRSSDFISVGGFYKYLDEPIQRIVIDPPLNDSNVEAIQYQNAIKGQIIGGELEVRKKLDGIPYPIIRKLSLNINASYMWHEAEIPGLNAEQLASIGVSTPSRKVPLQGASNWLVNAAIYYEDVESGTLVSAIYNYIGDRIRDYTSNPIIGDLYEARRSQLDIVFKKRFGDLLTVKLGAQDVFNQKRQFYRDQNLDGKFNPGINNARSFGGDGSFTGDFLRESFRPGSYYSIGISLNLLNN